MLRLFLHQRTTYSFQKFRKYSTSMSKYTSLIIEQVNVTEIDDNKIQYKTILGDKTFNEFILSHPSGAYTGMRTVQRNAIVSLNTHMTRMTNSISSIQFEGKTEAETEHAQKSLASLRDPILFEKKLIPLLRKGLEIYYEQVDDTTHSDHPFEAKVSLLATYSFETHQAYFAAHICKLRTIPLGKGVKVEVEKESRNQPEVKDSTWVRERQELEKNKREDVNEVILMDDKEQLYEGMASNFLAVSNNTVYCASLDHILLGTILKIVIDICEKNDIPLKWEFPRLEDARNGKWDGCFITSTSRLLLPIETIYVGHEIIEFNERPPLMRFLREQVSKEIYNTAYKILK